MLRVGLRAIVITSMIGLASCGPDEVTNVESDASTTETEFRVEGQTLSFKVPSVNGSWKGTIGKNGDSLTGTWTQGQSLPLEFTRDAFVPAKTASPIDGIWLGTSQVQGQTVRTQLIVKSNEQGRQSCAVDSPDMNLFELACANVAWASPELSFEVARV